MPSEIENFSGRKKERTMETKEKLKRCSRIAGLVTVNTVSLLSVIAGGPGRFVLPRRWVDPSGPPEPRDWVKRLLGRNKRETTR